MILESDNEATNILVDQIDVDTLNRSMWNLGMCNTMFGHLLCPGVPRYTSAFNEDGSNITSPNDMNLALRHIYDDRFSSLNPWVRSEAKEMMGKSNASLIHSDSLQGRSINAKIGVISDVEDGQDLHEVAIIDERLIVSIMMNKIGRELLQGKKYAHSVNTSHMYKIISNTLGEYLNATDQM